MSGRFLRGGFAVLMASAVSCSSGGGGGGGGAGTAGGSTKTYTLFWRADVKEPPGGVAVTAKVPAGWKEQIDATGSPEFEVEGLSSFGAPTIVLLHAPGADDAARMQWAIGQQFDDRDLAAAKREDLSGGRVWVQHDRGGGKIHARMFIPATRVEGVVMCVLMLSGDDAKQLPALRSFCESLAVTGA